MHRVSGSSDMADTIEQELEQAFAQLQRVLPTPARIDSEPKKQKRLPKVADLVVVRGPMPPPPARASDGNIHIWIYKICDEACYLWDDAKGVTEPLWQIQIQHDAPDSVAVNLYDKLSKFLSETDGLPDTLDELKHKALTKLVVTGNDDPDDVGFRRYRAALYVVGAMKNALYLLDDFWEWAHKDKESINTVEVHPHVGIDVDECWDNCSWPNYSLHPSARALKVFGC